MMKFTIAKNEQKCHLNYSMWDILILTVCIEPTHDTVCFLINRDVTGTVEIGHRNVCFDARKTEYDVMKMSETDNMR